MPGSAESSIEDILGVLVRFRILCVGKSGVGKSSLINRVFGVEKTDVAEWKEGVADIGKEITSKDNPLFVLHDSKGFGAGITLTFNLVANFIRERRKQSLPLSEQLHALWLCTEAPTAGGQPFEAGDQKLLEIAHETQTPVVVVFTKYDRLVRSKLAELREEGGIGDLVELSKDESQNALDRCMSSLKVITAKLKMRVPYHQSVSIMPGYEAEISSLVDLTGKVVQETLEGHEWVVWAVAQRASLSPKINPCAQVAMVYYKRSVMSCAAEVLLRDCLAEAHQEIITSWNFRDEEMILMSELFKQLMQYLVQDVQESQNDGEGHDTRSTAVDKIREVLDSISTTSPTAPRLPTESVFADWLQEAILYKHIKIQHLLIGYILELTTVLNLLLQSREPQSPYTISWLDLKKAFQAYERSDSRRQIHHRIREVFQHDQQILESDKFFQLIFLKMIKGEGQQWPREGGKDRSQSARVPTSQPSVPQLSAQSPSPSLSRFRRPRRMRIPRLCLLLSTSDHS